MKIQLRPRMFVLFISLGLLLLSVLDTGADQARYIYDDVGRLYRVIDEQGNVATYHYDAVGNIVGIERGAADAGPRVSGISPGVGAVDSLFDVVISGSGLSGSSVVADNPGINVSNVQTADSVITARFSISSTASLGPANITVSNVLGTAQTVLVIKPAAIHLDSVSPSSG
ncbi:MAG: RHS repeat domain-containing protein, partial [Anaerohalosphaeraceae bacterium]